MEQNKLKLIMYNLNIGSVDFWEFMRGKIHSFPNIENELPWACFPITDKNNILINIRVIVPIITDELTLLINIHELTHAYYLFQMLGKECIYEVEECEEKARNKEALYLKLTKENKLEPFTY